MHTCIPAARPAGCLRSQPSRTASRPTGPKRPQHHRIPDHLDEAALAGALAGRLAGSSASGARLSPEQTRATRVVWVQAGDEVLVHLESTRVRISERLVLVSVDLECDQIGRT